MLVDKLFGNCPEFSGDKVELRPFRLEDVSHSYLQWLNDPKVNAYSQRRGKTTSLEEARDFIECIHKSSTSCVLAIFLKKTDEHIGNLMLSDYDHRHGIVELSNLIGNVEYWGAGLVVEADKLILAELFLNHGLRKAVIGNIVQNRAATFMSKQLGFTLEGTLRRHLLLADLGACDVFRFGLLREEFFSKWPEYMSEELG